MFWWISKDRVEMRNLLPSAGGGYSAEFHVPSPDQRE